jgi:propanol-preferring alcohol dehydrogenase
MKGLRPRGRILALGATPDPVEVSTTDLLFGNRSIEGAITGDPATGDATLRFSALTGVAAMIETMPLEKAPGRSQPRTKRTRQHAGQPCKNICPLF